MTRAIFAYAMRAAVQAAPAHCRDAQDWDWGGAGQISEALGQDRGSSSLPINRYFFSFFASPKEGYREPIGIGRASVYRVLNLS